MSSGLCTALRATCRRRNRTGRESSSVAIRVFWAKVFAPRPLTSCPAMALLRWSSRSLRQRPRFPTPSSSPKPMAPSTSPLRTIRRNTTASSSQRPMARPRSPKLRRRSSARSQPSTRIRKRRARQRPPRRHRNPNRNPNPYRKPLTRAACTFPACAKSSISMSLRKPESRLPSIPCGALPAAIRTRSCARPA